MSSLSETLLAEIEAGADQWISLLQDFVRTPTPNPPGDTRAGTARLAAFLAARGLEHRLIAPKADSPNLVAQFDAARPGRHLVLNGHIDVFPASEPERMPRRGQIGRAALDGRGAADMKCAPPPALSLRSCTSIATGSPMADADLRQRRGLAGAGARVTCSRTIPNT
jgi:hypothetical protein